MKKLLSILLLLCLLCPAALADGADIYVAESHIHEYMEGENMHLHVVFVIENRGKSVFLPMSAAVVLMNEKGEIFADKPSSLYPMLVPAGEKGYVHGVFQLDAAMQAQYDHPELYLGIAEYSKDEMDLANQLCAAQVFPAVTHEINGSNLIVNVTNNTAIDITVGGMLILYKNEAGEIVGVQEAFIQNIPMNGSAAYDFSFTLAPFSDIEVLCYSLPM